jgi:hypothetical protein
MVPAREIVGTWEEILQQSNSFSGKLVKLILLDDDRSLPKSPDLDRAALLALPRSERDRILTDRAEAMAPEYEQDRDWREFLGGDFIEY